MVAAVQRADDPLQVFEIFLDGIRRAYPPRCFIMLTVLGLPLGQYRITRVKTADGTEVVPPGMLLEPAESLPVYSGGVFGAITQRGTPTIVHDLAPTDFPFKGEWFDTARSLMGVPIFSRDGITDLAVVLATSDDAFSEFDLENMLMRANLIGLALQNVRIVKQLREAGETIRTEVDRIASIQRALLPDRLPTVPGLTLAASYQTYDRAGGDIYDIRPLNTCGLSLSAAGNKGDSAFAARPADDNSPWALMVADVSGHGPAAAVVMAMLHAIIHAYPRIPMGPAEMLSHVNRHLTAKRIEQSFITAFMGFYYPHNRTLVYSNAGHPPPLVKDFGYGSKVIHLDEAGELPLGILDDVEYTEASVKLKAGQTLLLYTDGITEAAGPAGKMFGLEGLDRALANCSGDPDCIISTVHGVLRAHEAGRRPNDDQTLLAAQVAS